jgi:hypothetical protein
MKVYIVLDNSKDCYDAGGIYRGVFLSHADAVEDLAMFDRADRAMFEIIEEEMGVVTYV